MFRSGYSRTCLLHPKEFICWRDLSHKYMRGHIIQVESLAPVIIPPGEFLLAVVFVSLFFFCCYCCFVCLFFRWFFFVCVFDGGWGEGWRVFSCFVFLLFSIFLFCFLFLFVCLFVFFCCFFCFVLFCFVFYGFFFFFFFGGGGGVRLFHYAASE